jgi:hypothetical protein
MSHGAVRCATFAEEGYAGIVGLLDVCRSSFPGSMMVSPGGTICNAEDWSEPCCVTHWGDVGDRMSISRVEGT